MTDLFTLRSLSDFFSYIGEKIMLQDFGDAQQQFGVDGLSGEDIVDVSPIAVKLARKPCDGPCLGSVVEHLFYIRSNVHNDESSLFLCKITSSGALPTSPFQSFSGNHEKAAPPPDPFPIRPPAITQKKRGMMSRLS